MLQNTKIFAKMQYAIIGAHTGSTVLPHTLMYISTSDEARWREAELQLKAGGSVVRGFSLKWGANNSINAFLPIIILPSVSSHYEIGSSFMFNIIGDGYGVRKV